MNSQEYVDCELFLSSRNYARLSVAGREYSGRPTLDASLERRLLEAELEPVRYGTELFEALFQEGDGLLVGYRESLTMARHGGKRLRLRLHIAEAAPLELHKLHWELLYDPGRKIALARSQETAFSRYLGISVEPAQPVTSRPRLLVVLASPQDLADFDLPEIDRDEMRSALHQVLTPLADLMTCEILEGPATIERIRDRLVAGKFHALHLVAHGVLPPREQKARLVLEASDGRAKPVSEEVFAEVCDGQRNLRLISLIACHGGAVSGSEPFTGLGPALIERGVSSVVAMRRQVSITGATCFAEHFYRNLARSGHIDAAVNEARLQLYLADAESPDWSTPALFMRLAEGRLWQASSLEDNPDGEAQDDPGELLQPEGRQSKGESRQTSPVVRTLVVSELVGRGSLAEKLGDERMAELFGRYDRIAHDLLDKHEGEQAERASSSLMLFERPLNAVRWALDFHGAITELSEEFGVEVAFRVGVHLGEVVLIEDSDKGGGLGTKPIVVEGQARQISGRLTSLAKSGQTLLSAAAFDLARRGVVGTTPHDKLSWLAHGEYVLEDFTPPLAVFEVGIEGRSPLLAPKDSEKARRAAGDLTIVGWRPGVGLEVPQRPKWVLEKKLSEGGFGEVWLAKHQKMREQRVFKFCFEVERLRALQREITLFRLLKEELGDRDDIARILDWNFEEAPYFIESEYAADGNLLEWAEEQGGITAVPMAQRLGIIAQLATALSAAHSVGILHKDVKPANVLIASNPDGVLQVRLADFGIGTVTGRERLDAAGITVLGLTAKTEEAGSSYSGTRLYMAPEVLEGKRATLQADIFALGVLLYQMVVGDFARALAPGWRRGLDDALLCEDIGLAVDGSPKRRLGNALRISERLWALEERRHAHEAEQRRRDRSRRAQEALVRSRKRRKVMIVAIVILTLFGGTMTSLVLLYAEAKDSARNEAEVAQVILQFMVGLFKESDPAVAQGADITARELLDRGAGSIRRDFESEPLIQARLMYTMGIVYLELGELGSAQPLLKEALAIRQEKLSNKHPEVAASYSGLADLYRLLGRNKEAEPLYRRSLEILEELREPGHPALVSSLNGLGVLYWREGRYSESEALYRRSLEISEEASGQTDVDVAKALSNLANLYSSQGRYKEAKQMYVRALVILEKARGADHPEVAMAVENMGLVYLDLGDPDSAESFCLRALDIREKVLDPRHPDRATSYNNLAEVYRAQGRLKEAGEGYLRAAEVWSEALGEEHRSVGAAFSNLAEVYRLQGMYSTAKPLYLKALSIFRKTLEAGHTYIAFPLHGLATIYREENRPSDAESLYLQALTIREGALVEGHPDLQETLREFALLLRSLGRIAQAEELEERVLSASRLRDE